MEFLESRALDARETPMTTTHKHIEYDPEEGRYQVSMYIYSYPDIEKFGIEAEKLLKVRHFKTEADAVTYFDSDDI